MTHSKTRRTARRPSLSSSRPGIRHPSATPAKFQKRPHITGFFKVLVQYTVSRETVGLERNLIVERILALLEGNIDNSLTIRQAALHVNKSVTFVQNRIWRRAGRAVRDCSRWLMNNAGLSPRECMRTHCAATGRANGRTHVFFGCAIYCEPHSGRLMVRTRRAESGNGNHRTQGFAATLHGAAEHRHGE